MPVNKLKMPTLPKAQLPQLPKGARPANDIRRWTDPGDQNKALQVRWREWQGTERNGSNGSILEFICWEWLVKVKRMVEHVDFVYQWSMMGGRTQFGSFVPDFYFPSRSLVWSVAGLQFHYLKPQDRTKDILSSIVLANRGIKQVFVWEDDLWNRPIYTLEHSLQGEQVGARFKPD